jgi:hypothetical protein
VLYTKEARRQKANTDRGKKTKATTVRGEKMKNATTTKGENKGGRKGHQEGLCDQQWTTMPSARRKDLLQVFQSQKVGEGLPIPLLFFSLPFSVTCPVNLFINSQLLQDEWTILLSSWLNQAGAGRRLCRPSPTTAR